jgi:hypothetical protein
MGAAGTRFSRFVPINATYSETDTLYVPNPRTISQELFKRKSFTPATSINNLAAAWIQFQTHDWFVFFALSSAWMSLTRLVYARFSHGEPNDPNNYLSFDLPAKDPLRATGQTNMTIRATVKETHTSRPNTYSKLFANSCSIC